MHLLAPLMLEVDVDVRRLVALLGDEALEQHAHARRVDLGDADAIADDGVGRTAATLAEDVLRLGEAHDVGHGQEVVLVLQLADQLELVLDLQLHLRRHAVRPAPPGTFVGQAPQVGGRRLAFWHHLVRVLVGAARRARNCSARRRASVSARRSSG